MHALRSLPLIGILSVAVQAQQPTVELQLPTLTLELGEAVSAQLICTNTGRPDPPQISAPAGLALKLLSSTPSSSSFTQIVNGQMTQRATYTFPMQLTALQEGTYTLGPIVVNSETGTLRTSPVQLVVRKSDPGGKAQGDQFIFAELVVEPRSLYVTQTILTTLTFGIRKVELSGRVFEVDMLRDVLDANGSQLSVFANGRAQRSERWLADSAGSRHPYEVFRVTKEVRAEQVGDMPIGPVFLKAEYPTGLRRGFFGGYEVTSRRRETARTDAVAVTVKGPPTPGRPADFTGAIGEYTFSVTAKPTEVEQNQPITLTISIRGSPVEGIAGPDLIRQPELASRFDYTKDELVGDVSEEMKVFRRAIFPKQPGPQNVPSLTWSYFDPKTERYVALKSDPIPIEVRPASTTAGTITLDGEETAPDSKATKLTLLSGGLSPNYVNADAVLTNQVFELSSGWITILIGSPAMWVLVTFVTQRRSRLAGDPLLRRRQNARKLAKKRVRQALQRRSELEQWEGLSGAFTGYVADRFGLAEGALTAGEVRAALQENGFDGALVGEISSFLEQCDATRYSPSANADGAPSQAAADVGEWIRRIERGR